MPLSTGIPIGPSTARKQSRAQADDALFQVASPAERAMVLLGLDALLRLGDVRRLKAEHDRGTYLDVVDPKTDRAGPRGVRCASLLLPLHE